jgi:hypothetical protein
MFRRKPSSKPATHAPRKAVEGVLLAFAMAWIAGCQGVSAGPPGQHGSLSLGSSALNFGSVAAGSSKTLTVSATNFGNAPVSLRSSFKPDFKSAYHRRARSPARVHVANFNIPSCGNVIELL